MQQSVHFSKPDLADPLLYRRQAIATAAHDAEAGLPLIAKAADVILDFGSSYRNARSAALPGLQHQPSCIFQVQIFPATHLM